MVTYERSKIKSLVPIVGIVVTISPSFSLYRMVVFPAASRPTIRMRISFFPHNLSNSLEKVRPMLAADVYTDIGGRVRWKLWSRLIFSEFSSRPYKNVSSVYFESLSLRCKYCVKCKYAYHLPLFLCTRIAIFAI